MGFGSIVKRAGLAISTGGISEVARVAIPKLGDMLKGKTIPPDQEAALVKQLKLKGLGAISGELDAAKKSPTGEAIAGAGVARELKGLTGAKEDTQRRLRELIAQKGLGRTSAGLAQQVGLGRKFAEKGAAIKASLPERIQQQRLLRSQRIAGLGSQLSGQVGQVPLRFQATKKPGIGGLLGTIGGGAAGALFGGPSGAVAGSQIGGGIGSQLG